MLKDCRTLWKPVLCHCVCGSSAPCSNKSGLGGRSKQPTQPWHGEEDPARSMKGLQMKRAPLAFSHATKIFQTFSAEMQSWAPCPADRAAA